MGIFSRPQLILWPKANHLEIYFFRPTDNHFSFDFNLWAEIQPSDLSTLKTFIAQSKAKDAWVIVSDEYMVRRTFVYDSKIDAIDTGELISIAKDYVDFPIESDAISSQFETFDDKTLILTTIKNKPKLDQLHQNLSELGLSQYSLASTSELLARVFSRFYPESFLAIYPTAPNDNTLFIAQNNRVYLSASVKNQNFEIQKTLNYSKLYFSSPIKKIYIPEGFKDNHLPTRAEYSVYDETQIARQFNLSSNLPLPVIATSLSDIISSSNLPPSSSNQIQSNMEPKKSILPIIAVFVVTAVIASLVIGYVLNRNKALSGPSVDDSLVLTPAPTEVIPTATPTPTIAEISKTLKIQVLNGTEINGQAALLKNQVTTLGFTSVNTGNAPETATQNTIRTKPDGAANSAYFMSRLPDFAAATVAADLPTTSTYDVVLTIGSQLSTTAIPTTATTSVAPTAVVTVTTPVTATPAL
ncbi:MAG: LytR C-terminal domain-containing protein [Candidatus Shapirobacteria bacterium]